MRNRPSNRRPQVIIEVPWGNRTITVGIGYDAATAKPCEVFADLDTTGELAIVCRDAAVAISIALQYGASPAELEHSMLSVPDGNPDDGKWKPASPIGAIVAALVREAP